MASGPTCRAKRPNTWLHRPMLHTFKKVLANSEPSTHGGKADMAFCGISLSRSLLGVKRTSLVASHMWACESANPELHRAKHVLGSGSCTCARPETTGASFSAACQVLSCTCYFDDGF